MAKRNDLMHFLPVTSRLVRKLCEPGVLSTSRRVMRVDGAEHLSLGLLLAQRAAETPSGTALIYGGRQWTWQAFDQWSNRYAHALAQYGVCPGDVVGINLRNAPELLVCVAAVAKLGAVSALFNTSQAGQALAHSLNLVAPRVTISDADQWPKLQALTADKLLDQPPDVLLVDASSGAPQTANLDALAAKQPSSPPSGVEDIRLDQPCFYVFTSGTTGLPKASVMSHLRWYRSGLGTARVTLGLERDDVFYCCLPLYHNTALTLVFGACVNSGAALAIGREFSASQFWGDIRAAGATAFAYVGEIPRYLLNKPPTDAERDHKVRLMFGNGLRPELWDAVKQRFGVDRIIEFYGASEGTNGFVNLFNFERTCGWSAMGWAVVPWDVETESPVRESNGRMRKLGRGDTGLLLTEVSETLPFDGYTDGAASEAKLLRDVFKPGDCWFNSGDLVLHQGYGHIQFVDRTGDTFRWRGENVATTELERSVATWPGIDDAIAYGVEIPGCEGRCGMLAVYGAALSTTDLRRLAEHLRSTLAPYAVPRFLRVLSAPLLTGSYKHRKNELRQQGINPDQTDGDAIWLLTPISSDWQPMDAATLSRIESGAVAL